VTIDLGDMIEPLQREVNPPGSDLFPDAVEDEWLGNLRDSFWEAKLFGFFSDFTEAEGLVSPITGTDDLGREYQQLVVLFAGARIVTNELKNTETLFRAVAGPVEFETQNSATLLRDILKEIRDKIKAIVEVLSDDFGSTEAGYIDAIVDRHDALAYGETYHWR